jgi:hypothetical protein
VHLHAQLSAKLKGNEAERLRITNDMRHVEATIQLFDPAFNLRRISAKRRNVVALMEAVQRGQHRKSTARNRGRSRSVRRSDSLTRCATVAENRRVQIGVGQAKEGRMPSVKKIGALYMIIGVIHSLTFVSYISHWTDRTNRVRRLLLRPRGVVLGS